MCVTQANTMAEIPHALEMVVSHTLQDEVAGQFAGMVLTSKGLPALCAAAEGEGLAARQLGYCVAPQAVHGHSHSARRA